MQFIGNISHFQIADHLRQLLCEELPDDKDHLISGLSEAGNVIFKLPFIFNLPL